MRRASSPPGGVGQAKARYVQSMFAGIAGRYDVLNDLMTAGRHRAWKRATARLARPAGCRALDLGSGTGDITRELARRDAAQVVAVDFVAAMHHVARERLTEVRDPRQRARIDPLVADALRLPFPEATFDCLTSGFLVRNVADLPRAFAEMQRVLKPGGRMICLEASRRDGRLGRLLMGAFGVQARLLGRLVAGAPAAYAYLPDSAAAFHSPQELADIIRSAGFPSVRYRRYALGLVAIHWARKPG